MIRKVLKGQEVEMPMDAMVAMDDAQDGILCGYPEVAKAFNEMRNGRFITEKKLARKCAEMFPGHTQSETVLKNFIIRCKNRFLIPPIGKDSDGLLVKITNIRNKKLEYLSVPKIIWERLGNPKV
jgi:hypothetical protein